MAVVDMLGRLFGVMLATLFEKTPQKLSAAQERLSETLSEFRRCFEPGVRDRATTASASASASAQRPAQPEIDAVRAELDELKQQLRQDAEATTQRGERADDLISASESFFKAQDKLEIHVIPFRAKPVTDGLVAFLGRNCVGNPHDKGVISVTGAPDDSSAGYQPRNAADLQGDSYFHSQSGDDQYLAYDFKSMRITVTHYLLGSAKQAVNWCHPRSRALEVSDDGSEWREIDRQECHDGLNGPDRLSAFPVRFPTESRFIRIRQTGLNAAGSKQLIIRAFELFGGIRLHDPVKLN
jgi:hypothetical protein